MQATTTIRGTCQSGRRQIWTLAGLAGVLAISASCSGTEVEGAAIADQEEWCAAMTEIDLLLTDGEINSHDFNTARSAAEDIHQLFTQLRAGVDQVDPEVRDSVNAEIDYGLAFTSVYAEANDFESAMVELQKLSSGDASDGAAGRAWILENCGIDTTD